MDDCSLDLVAYEFDMEGTLSEFLRPDVFQISIIAQRYSCQTPRDLNNDFSTVAMLLHDTMHKNL